MRDSKVKNNLLKYQLNRTNLYDWFIYTLNNFQKVGDVEESEEKTDEVDFKTPGVCRIFISSPFNGLEEEREELTKRHWPRIQTLCASRGVQLRIVDMRWGITHHATVMAQTALICLKELDRSDIFVGFFGQVTYGDIIL